MTTLLLTPVYNDWESFNHLIREIDIHLSPLGERIEVVAVDDSSTEPAPPSELTGLVCIKSIHILSLARNLGHQRAIAVGLSYIQDHLQQADRIVVLDSDGEDRPQDIPLLIAESKKNGKIVFARRGSRTEDWVFRLFYRLYRIIFQTLTGKAISFGNFSVIPMKLLVKVVHLPEIWNHFAAGIMRSGLPQSTVVLGRGKRYAGKSKMNFVGLVLHGLSAISVYTDIMTVRMILFTFGVIAAVIIAFVGLLYIRFMTLLAIPGWATTVGLGLVMMLFQAILLLMSLAFLALSARSANLFIPIKQYQDYLLESEIIYDQP